MHPDCIATSRNCSFPLQFNGKEYSYDEHYEPSPYKVETDFPILIDVSTNIKKIF